MTTSEGGAGWVELFRDAVTRVLSGVKTVTSAAHAGLVSVIGATLDGAAWQRWRPRRAGLAVR